MDKRLYRSQKEKMLAGVCGGAAEYLGVDPTIVRLGVAALAFPLHMLVIPAYIICAVVIPVEPTQTVWNRPGENTASNPAGFGTVNSTATEPPVAAPQSAPQPSVPEEKTPEYNGVEVSPTKISLDKKITNDAEPVEQENEVVDSGKSNDADEQ